MNKNKEFDSQHQHNRTSFLIEDILYRRQKQDEDEFLKEEQKIVADKREKSAYGYFQPVQNNGCAVQPFQGHDNGYIQVMGALGAYLGTPYKTMTDPYFLTQGKIKLFLV